MSSTFASSQNIGAILSSVSRFKAISIVPATTCGYRIISDFTTKHLGNIERKVGLYRNNKNDSSAGQLNPKFRKLKHVDCDTDRKISLIPSKGIVTVEAETDQSKIA